ncbi:hypothetical protein C8D99_101257 [Aminivibrio pyruvatiphilus]|uniref:Uncharacterized protein n=1 Tax=Aminivibrio pyruvatiphilus TaxID=1005740 RepID=A0A4R8MKA0_9BACT|nr:hypothetical protein C8D99_101257 [Aminivibrio pyruvatiphilus]
MDGGGVIPNLGSAVLLPEVFLKALSIARNLGNNFRNIITANMDMIQHYRPLTDVVTRPVISGGQGYLFSGHHEIMILLLAAAVCEEAFCEEMSPVFRGSGMILSSERKLNK